MHLMSISGRTGFVIVQKNIEKKVGYSMTANRIAELVMYSNGAKRK